mmetsp:Transcript_12299/g.25121  ORF Transcript_12299/g.25121 Transcript_12299/m.25121 type:complete len:419 (-) Transcript_12299:1521-2777(-)
MKSIPAARGIQPFDSSDKGEPVALAPRNVFLSNAPNNQHCLTRWTNYYELPIEYRVEIHHGIFQPSNPTLATEFMPDSLPEKRRFLVVDNSVDDLYGQEIRSYFDFYGVRAHLVIIRGEEENKRFDAVEKVFQELCTFGLHRREPIIAVGGGVVLDVVGFVASIYRRGVPYIRVPTTLLALVDASVGVKTGVDFVSDTKGPLKNRMGSFHAPCAAYLDKRFISTQNTRNIVNGLGEIMKLALVRSVTLFELLEKNGARIVEEKFQGEKLGEDQVINLSIQIMLEELGPNLWEYDLERCVDFGHSFSKIIEMQCTDGIMHGEAVNVDGFFCCILSWRRGLLTREELERVFLCMKSIGLPTIHTLCQPDTLWRGVEDAIEHRHGQQRIPLVRGIGHSVIVNDITREEIVQAVGDLESIHQ